MENLRHDRNTFPTFHVPGNIRYQTPWCHKEQEQKLKQRQEQNLATECPNRLSGSTTADNVSTFLCDSINNV